MRDGTRQMWADQDRHVGDRWRLFQAVGEAVEAASVLYPGSFVDISPSFVFPRVTYVDSDRRTPAFFPDADGVLEIVAAHEASPARPVLRFIHGDYTQALDLPDESFDLLVSLYAGPVSDHCTPHRRIGGILLVNPSHGDAALASVDRRFRLAGVVTSGSGTYCVSTDDLDGHLVPKGPVEVTAELVRETGRGIAYTRTAFAYLFERIG